MDVLLRLVLFAILPFLISGGCTVYVFKDKKKDFMSYGTLLFFTLSIMVLPVKIMGIMKG